MQWNYRVVRFTDSYNRESYRIHEAYYQDDKVTAISDEPIYPTGENISDLNDDIQRMLKAFDKPVLNYSDI